MDKLTTPEQVDGVMKSGRAILYKHSTRCPISAGAHEEVRKFLAGEPEVPVFMVDVLNDGDVSRHVAGQTGVEHHSPQAILVSEGAVVWHASHHDITADTLRRQVEDLGR